MSLNRDYKIKLDIQTGKIDNQGIIFASADQNISNILVEFKKQGKVVDLTGYSIIANIQKPDTLMIPQEVAIVDAINGIGEIDLPLNATIDEGFYNVEIEMTKDNEVSHSQQFKYSVRDTLCGELDDTIVDDSNYNLLIKLVGDVNQLEFDVRRNEDVRTRKENERIVDETIRCSNETKRIANESNREIRVNDLMTDVESRVNTVEDRVDKAIAAGTIDLEVKDARGEHDSLRQRLEQIETNPMIYWEVVEG